MSLTITNESQLIPGNYTTIYWNGCDNPNLQELNGSTTNQVYGNYNQIVNILQYVKCDKIIIMSCNEDDDLGVIADNYNIRFGIHMLKPIKIHKNIFYYISNKTSISDLHYIMDNASKITIAGDINVSNDILNIICDKINTMDTLCLHKTYGINWYVLLKKYKRSKLIISNPAYDTVFKKIISKTKSKNIRVFISCEHILNINNVLLNENIKSFICNKCFIPTFNENILNNNTSLIKYVGISKQIYNKALYNNEQRKLEIIANIKSCIL